MSAGAAFRSCGELSFVHDLSENRCPLRDHARYIAHCQRVSTKPLLNCRPMTHHRRPPRLRRADRPAAGGLSGRKPGRDAVCAAFEGDDGRWQVAVHFSAPPDEQAVRALVALAAGDEAAAALHVRAGRRRRLGRAKAWPACGRCAPAASSCTARMTAPASNPTTSASRSRRRSPSAPATTAPRAAACWRSTIWRSGGAFRRVLDLGTGSGVLAIAAAKIFRTRVIGERHRPRRGRCRAQPMRGSTAPARRSPSCAPPATNARVISARRALRSDLRQYPAGAADAAGGAAAPPRRRRTRASCCPACCRPMPMRVLAIYRAQGLCARSGASCSKAG